MSRKKEKKKNIVNEIRLPDNISKDEWQHIIANAIVEADELKEKKKEEIKKAQSAKRKGFRGFIKLMFCPKKVVEGDFTTTSLLKQPMILLLNIAAIILLLFGLLVLAIVPISHYFASVNTISWFALFFSIPFGILTLMFARVFHIASLEIDKIDDSTYVFGAFASFYAIISVVISIIALIKGV